MENKAPIGVRLLLILCIAAFAYCLGAIIGPHKRETPTIIVSPQQAEFDSLVVVVDSIAAENRILDQRMMVYKLGLGQLKMVDKRAYDYVINAGNLKFPQDL